MRSGRTGSCFSSRAVSAEEATAGLKIPVMAVIVTVIPQTHVEGRSSLGHARCTSLGMGRR